MRKLEIGVVYKHFKGNLYRAEDIATHSDSAARRLQKSILHTI